MVNQQRWLVRDAIHMPHTPQGSTDVSMNATAGLTSSTQTVAMIRGDFASPMPRMAATLMMRKKLTDMPTVSGWRLQIDMMGPASRPARRPTTRERLTVILRTVWK